MSMSKGCGGVLRALGWSCKEAALRNRDGSCSWEVHATRLGHKIVAWGRTRIEAWEIAYRQAKQVHQRG
ncbi:MAG: hypothetical protein ACUVUC_13070 [Thermoguttaceae bacterium]